MFTPSLIHMAVLVYFSVSSGHGIDFEFHDGTKSAMKVEEKVVLRECPLSEKCGLGLETVTRPDKEIVALQSSASDLKSAIALGERIRKQTPEKLPDASKWKEKFVLSWDEEGGLNFDRTYHPASKPDWDPCPACGKGEHRYHPDPALFPIFSGFMCGGPVGCGPVSPTECGVDDAHRTAFKPDSRGRTPNDFYDYPDSTFLLRR
ncbi:MAG: hypothetical protein ACLP9L_23655 [Thermoguttaceae bacterium]